MRLGIAGGREFRHPFIVDRAVAFASSSASWVDITEVVTGGAPGIDELAEVWAATMGYPVTTFPADWKTYGRAAGPKRNEQIADYIDALLAIPGRGTGTRDMIRRARARELPVWIYEAAGRA